MELMKVETIPFTNDQILEYVNDYERDQVPGLTKLWRYYKADNPTIVDKRAPDPNNPDNRTVVGYGRKIVTTFTGYAYRPRYITYQSENKAYYDAMHKVFDGNREHIRTSRAGRNTAIFGVAYEVCYVRPSLNGSVVAAEPRFISVRPQELILFYDFEAEPEKIAAIRYYKINPDKYKVEVYYTDRVERYDRLRDDSGKWRLVSTGTDAHYFGAVPVVAYYFGDDMLGIIRPVASLIDDYDLLMSDSINEFDRFSNAYLILKKMHLVDPVTAKDPDKRNRVLQDIKRRRVFENVPSEGDIKFLTKDIPTAFVDFMTAKIREQIHVQSHVPDFTSEAFGGAVSGEAIKRLMFDFENVVSSAEADFDEGLYERIKLVTRILRNAGLPVGDPEEITIAHKRNMPLNLKEFAETGQIMKNTGFSSYLVADIMPDDIIPDVEVELERQRQEREGMVDLDAAEPEDEEENEEEAEEEQAE